MVRVSVRVRDRVRDRGGEILRERPFPAYFPAYSLKTRAPSSRFFNYILARCARCGVS